jgi:hypothetical protein
LEHKPPSGVEEYRRRFRHAPSGKWQTAQGTFDAVSTDTLTFLPDHTGFIEYRSSFSGASTVRFHWREKAERTIEVRYLDDDETSTDATDTDVNDADVTDTNMTNADELWEEISYDFKPLDTDTPTREIVLHEAGQQGFWDFDAPLRLVSSE